MNTVQTQGNHVMNPTTKPLTYAEFTATLEQIRHKAAELVGTGDEGPTDRDLSDIFDYTNHILENPEGGEEIFKKLDVNFLGMLASLGNTFMTIDEVSIRRI